MSSMFDEKTSPVKLTKKQQKMLDKRRKPVRAAAFKSTPALIRELLDENVPITENGTPRRCSVYEAIVTRLWIKASEGNARANRVLEKYEQFAAETHRPPEPTAEEKKQDALMYEMSLTLRDDDPSLTTKDDGFRLITKDMSPKEAARIYEEFLRNYNDEQL